MKKLGLKKMLYVSTMLCVALSVSISSFILYQQERKQIQKLIISDSTHYVAGQAKVIEAQLNEKVAAIKKLTILHQDIPLVGTASEIIQQTKFLAASLNLNSAVIAFESGDAYWNQSSNEWPGNKFDGDVKIRPWYKEAMNNVSKVTISTPYEYDGAYWLTITGKIKDGMINGDMKLDFLDELVSSSSDISYATVLIFDESGTVLASSSPVIKSGQNVMEYDWFKVSAERAMRFEKSMSDYSFNSINKILFSHRIRIGDKSWTFAIGLDKSKVYSSLTLSRNIAIFVGIIATIVSVIIAFIIINITYRPIIELKNTVLGLSSGDGSLTKRLTVSTDDDLGKIAQGVNQFVDKIQILLVRKEENPSSLPLAKEEKELNQLSDTFKQRWKDAFDQYKTRVHRESEFRDELKLDKLTKLPTRSYFEILLSDAIKDVYTEKNDLLLVTVSLENYEAVAEKFTYERMQSAILELTGIIEAVLPKNVVLSRTAQDEFSIIFKNSIDNLTHEALVSHLASAIRTIETKAMIFNCKLGASSLSYSDDRPTVSGLFYQVNNALYSIANDTTSTYAFYHKEDDIEKEERQRLISDFKRALIEGRDELELYFQPQVCLKTNEIIGAEALIRWNHPQKGFLTPDKFVYILSDDLQLNTQFGEWLMASALERLSDWKDNLSISVNITTTHLQRDDFFEQLESILNIYPRSVAQRFKIELTETISISNYARIEASMRRCSELGVRFSLDDFGTGYSTLDQLRKLPVSELKIDRSFVQNIENSDEDRMMVSTIIMLAKRFEIDVVVEGVENSVQESYFAKFGDLTMQGYFYFKPLPYPEFSKLTH